MSRVGPSDSDDLFSRPLILIGCGRSGSTLFSRVLDAHPDVQFLVETDFLIARVWREVWDNRFWLNFEHHMRRDPKSSREAPVIPAAEVAAAKDRAARGVRMLFAEMMQLDPAMLPGASKRSGMAIRPWRPCHGACIRRCFRRHAGCTSCAIPSRSPSPRRVGTRCP